MIEALWSIVFETAEGILDGGVIAVQDGKLIGGDRSYYYVGAYRVDGDRVAAELDVVHYSGLKLPHFGSGESVRIKLSGAAGAKTMELAARVAGGSPAITTVKLQRRAELP